MWHWLHHLLNPHCEQCATDTIEREERNRLQKQCPVCEVYRTELDKAHRLNDYLTDQMLRKPEVVEEQPFRTQTEIKPKFVPWEQRRRILEADKRKEAELLKVAAISPITEDDLDAELDEARNA